MSPEYQSQVIDIWRAGVAAVKGEVATRQGMERMGHCHWDRVLAVGKAASSMMLGAKGFIADQGKGLVVTKYGHIESEIKNDHRITIIESAHPEPDERSLQAGTAMEEFVDSVSSDHSLLVLVSGGASALAEVLNDGMDLSQLKKLTNELLDDGYSIDQINHIRIGISKIKGGKLLRHCRAKKMQVLGISDIPSDDEKLIGSGIAALSPAVVAPFSIPTSIARLMESRDDNIDIDQTRYQCELIATNEIARNAAMAAAEKKSLNVIVSEQRLSGDIMSLADDLAQKLIKGPPGLYIWGGEPTVKLPKIKGYGGRNQSLGLALALALRSTNCRYVGVIAGTDGTDGPTHAAGALIDSEMDLDGADAAIVHADAGTWLDQNDHLFVTGPTGTNVMDLAVLLTY